MLIILFGDKIIFSYIEVLAGVHFKRTEEWNIFSIPYIYIVIYPFEADVYYNTNTPYHITITLDCFAFLLATAVTETKHGYFKIIVLRACI